MTKLESLESEIQKLTPEELDSFRRWFVEFDWQQWDEEIERDAAAGKLDRFIERARENVRRGKTREL